MLSYGDKMSAPGNDPELLEKGSDLDQGVRSTQDGGGGIEASSRTAHRAGGLAA